MINLTFVIQIINFWITYVVLHRFLFKPFVDMIIRKQEIQAKMLSGLKEKEQMLETLQEEKVKNLDEFRAYLKKRYVVTPPHLVEIAAEVSYQKNEQQCKQLVTQASALIVQKVAHAD